MKPPARVEKRAHRKYSSAPKQIYLDACKEIREKGISIRRASQKFKVNYSTLRHFKDRLNKSMKGMNELSTMQAKLDRMQPADNLQTIIPNQEITNHSAAEFGSNRLNKHSKQIFSDEQETELTVFVRDTSDYYNGMTSKDVRVLAFVYGVCNQVNLPLCWQERNEATIDWCWGFIKRKNLRSLITSS